MHACIPNSGINQDALIEVSHFSAHDIREAQRSLIRKRSVASILFRRGVNSALGAIVPLGKASGSDGRSASIDGNGTPQCHWVK